MLTGIASIVVTLLAAIYTAIILPTLQQYLSARATQLAKQREETEAEQAAINLTYLNPLRLWLEETYVRLADISARLAETGHCEPLLFIETPGAISEQSLVWFNGAGCYLTSTCYITTCLFFAIKQVRDNIPYLRLSRRSDKALMTLLFGVSHGFLRDFGIYYVTQPSIGHDIYLAAQGRPMTYREYCQWLRLAENRLWCDRLIEFYLETGRGKHRDRLSALLTAIAALSEFLDEHIGEGVSLAERLRAEKIANPKAAER